MGTSSGSLAAVLLAAFAARAVLTSATDCCSSMPSICRSTGLHILSKPLGRSSSRESGQTKLKVDQLSATTYFMHPVFSFVRRRCSVGLTLLSFSSFTFTACSALLGLGRFFGRQGPGAAKGILRVVCNCSKLQQMTDGAQRQRSASPERGVCFLCKEATSRATSRKI